MEPRKFYVYVVFRSNGVPCYVGKGQGGRWRAHIRKSHNRRLQHIYAKAGDLPVVKVREGLSSAEACQTEIALIAAIGRAVDGGPLVNVTAGGEGMLGRPQSEEHYRSLSERYKGKPRPAHVIEAVRAAANDRSPEWFEKQRQSHKGNSPSEATRLKMSASKFRRRGKDIAGISSDVLVCFHALNSAGNLTTREIAATLGISWESARKWRDDVYLASPPRMPKPVKPNRGLTEFQRRLIKKPKLTPEERSEAQRVRNRGNKWGVGNKRTPEGQVRSSAAVAESNRRRITTNETRQKRRQIAIAMNASKSPEWRAARAQKMAEGYRRALGQI